MSDTQFDGTGTHIIGGQRDVTFQKITGSSTQPYANVLSTVTYLGYTGISTYNSFFNCNAVWTTTCGLAGDLNADLTAGGTADRISLVIDGDQDDSVPVRPIPLTITVISGTGTAAVTKDLVNYGIHSFLYTEFACVDFADVDRLVFEIEQDSQINDAIDFALLLTRSIHVHLTRHGLSAIETIPAGRLPILCRVADLVEQHSPVTQRSF